MANDNLYGVVLNAPADNARIIDAPASGGGGLASALSTLASGVKGVSDMWDRAAQRKRQDAADARAAQDQSWQAQDRARTETERNIGSDVAIASAAIDQGADLRPAPPPIELVNEVATAVGKLKIAGTAVEQGRLPPITREAQLQNTFNALVQKYGPQHAGAIAKSFRDNGVGNALTDEITAEMDAEQANRKAGVEFDNRMIEVARTHIDPKVAAGMSREELIDHGITVTKNDNEIALLQKRATLQSTTTSTEQSQYNFKRQVNNDQYSVITNDQAMTALQPIAQQMQKILFALGEPGADPSLETRYAELLTLAKTASNNIVNSIIQRGGYTNAEQADAARKRLNDYIQSTLLDPYEQRNKGFATAVDVFQKHFGFAQKLSAPVINDLRTRFGINPGDIPGLVESLPPAVLEGLKGELAGVGRPGINENIATIHLTNILSVMKGEKNLNHIDTPAERQAIVAQSWGYVKNNAGIIARGEGNADAWMNSTRQLVIASAGFGPSTHINNIAAASLAMFDAPTMNAVQKLSNNPATAEEAKILGQGLRASAAVTLSAVQQQIKGQPITQTSAWRVGVDKDGKAVIWANPKWKTANVPGPSTEMTGFEPRGVTGRPPIPPQLQKMVDVFNATTGFLARTAAWDDESPKGSQREIRMFWATGRPTEDMKKQQQQKRSSGANVRTMMDQIEKDLIKAPDMLEAPDGSVTEAIMGVEGLGKDPNSNAHGGFMPATWLSLVKTNRPDLAEGKSDAEILALRSNKGINGQMIGFYARDNSQRLVSNGLPASTGNLNLMHLFGETEGIKVLKADPNTPIEQLVRPIVLQQNAWMRGKTVAEIRKARKA